MIVLLVSAVGIILLIVSWVIILQLQKRHSRQQVLLQEAENKDLTPINLRVCAYLRIGLDQKQIAQLLNISYGSIRTHCYRTKKKLGLPEDESLDDFIRCI